MNAATTKAAEGFSRRAFNVDDISRMIEAGILREDEKFELIEGDIVMVSPKPIAHELIKNTLGMAFVRLAPDTVVAAIATTLQLSDYILVDPDIAIFANRVFKAAGANYFAQPSPPDIDLVVEIAATSLAFDRSVKARLYARFGIREFWLIDAYERITWVYTCPNDDEWSSIIEHGPHDVLTTPALPGFSIRLGDIG
jgi:Uma2 family endonuclease